MRTLFLFIAAIALCLPALAEDVATPKKTAEGYYEIDASPKELTDFVIDYGIGTLAFRYKGVWVAMLWSEAKPAEASIAASTFLSDLQRAKRIHLLYFNTLAEKLPSCPWVDEKKTYNRAFQPQLFF